MQFANWSSDLSGVGNINVDSFVVGAGLETMVGHNVSLGVNVDYLTPNNVSANGSDVTKYVQDSDSSACSAP